MYLAADAATVDEVAVVAALPDVTNERTPLLLHGQVLPPSPRVAPPRFRDGIPPRSGRPGPDLRRLGLEP